MNPTEFSNYLQQVQYPTEISNYPQQVQYPTEIPNYSQQYPTEFSNYLQQVQYPTEISNYPQQVQYPTEIPNYSQQYPTEFSNYLQQIQYPTEISNYPQQVQYPTEIPNYSQQYPTEFSNYLQQVQYPTEFSNYLQQVQYPTEISNYPQQVQYPTEIPNYSHQYPTQFSNYLQQVQYPTEISNYSHQYTGPMQWQEHNNPNGYASYSPIENPEQLQQEHNYFAEPEIDTSNVEQVQSVNEEEKYYEVHSAFKKNILTYAIPNKKDELIYEDLVAKTKSIINEIVEKSLLKYKIIKFNITLVGEYMKIAGEELELCTISHSAKMDLLCFGDNKDDLISKQLEKIDNKMSEFQERDSGWTLIRIIKLEININKSSLVKGSSWIRTPDKLAKKHACINIENYDNYCFKWALVAALDTTKIAHKERCSSYNIEDISAQVISLQNGIVLDFSNLSFPLPLKNIKDFEELNSDISVNVFGYDDESNEIIGPYYITKNEKLKHVNLLLLENGSSQHYIFIRNISKLIGSQLTSDTHSVHICNSCLQHTHSDDIFNKHKLECGQIVTKMPSMDDNILRYKDHHRQMDVPFVIYGDFECILENMQLDVSEKNFAVTAENKIVFYDEHWREITSSAHQFNHLSAIAFDETEEIVYFADRVHNNGSIFSLKIPTGQDDPHIIEKIVQKTQMETITSIAYDPLNRNLYWADQLNRKIHFISIDAQEYDLPKTLIDFEKESTLPQGIAIDICRRKIYWTNSNFKNASIERMDLSGDSREVIVNKNLFLPRGIVVDQLSDRLYWVVEQQGIHFTVESSSLDGSDREIIVKGLDSTPSNLAVTKDLVFWTDQTHDAVWTHVKLPKRKLNETDEQDEDFTKPHIVLRLEETPSGIVSRSRYMTTLQNDQHCSAVVTKVKHHLVNAPQTKISKNKTKEDYCLNDGEYIQQSGICICKLGFKGARCETNECHNYCVHGTCTISSSSFPKCACQRGFYGERCQSYRCSGFCFNEGVCKIENNGEPTCECQDNFGGQRCEQNSTEICALFCRILKHDPDAYAPFGCRDICEELASASEDAAQMYAIPTYKHLEVCHDQVTWTNTLIMALVTGVVLCLALVLLIVHGVRRFYKPARPRIKKTFVVRRSPASSSDTPLTNRPIATEQCEITIENCCNMNYCDTPCFDPKLVQQTLSRDTTNTKEDKKILINSMEDDLY